MSKALFASISSLAFLGMLGGCLVLARSGFTASSKYSRWQAFVPTPQAYAMALLMFALSVIAVIWLGQRFQLKTKGYIAIAAIYAAAARVMTYVLGQVL